MAALYELNHDIFASAVPHLAEPLDVDFETGMPLQTKLPLPVVFTSNHKASKIPSGFQVGDGVPVMSDVLIQALQAAGVANLECFPAEIRSKKDGSIWTGYQVVNVIGLVACANLAASTYTHIMARPGGALPLLAFEELKVDPTRAGGALLFRLAEEPGKILIDERVAKALLDVKTDMEWGVTLDVRS